MSTIDRRLAKGLLYLAIFVTISLGVVGAVHDNTVLVLIMSNVLGIIIICNPGGHLGKYIWPRRLVKAFQPAEETKCPPGHSICPECGKIEKIGEETGCH